MSEIPIDSPAGQALLGTDAEFVDLMALRDQTNPPYVGLFNPFEVRRLIRIIRTLQAKIPLI